MFYFLRYSLATCLISLFFCSGCAHQPIDHSEELKQIQQTVNQQDAQGLRVEKRQDEILLQVQQLQSQLIEQQKMLEAKPQIIEKITRIECPPVTPKASKFVKSIKAPSNIDKQIVGLREQVLLTGIDLVMPAKISPQLANSILDARNIQMFERNSDEWVRFTLYNPENNEPHVLERKLLGFQNIQGTNKTTERRPMVDVRFTIGKLTQKGSFVLADRSSSSFPVVLGRNLLRDVMLIDVSGENLAPLKREEKTNTESPDKK